MAVGMQHLALLRLATREWWRTRSVALLAVAIASVFALAHFLAGLAVTEVTAQRVTLYAGLVRPVLVLLFALAIVVGFVREFDDRVLETLLARPLSRGAWYVTRLAGHLLAGAVLACAAALPLVPLAPLDVVAAWTLSFGCELAIVAAFAFAGAASLGRVAPAMGAVAGFYTLARSIAVLVLAVGGGASEPGHVANSAVGFGIRALALVLPDLSRYAQSVWLLDDGRFLRADLTYGVIEGALYVAFLGVLGRLDFARRDL